MKIRHSLAVISAFLCLSSIASSVFAAEELEIEFSYGENHGVDFSQMKGSLKIGSFSDQRNLDNPQLITDNDFGNSNASGGYLAETAVTDIIQSALTQGFASGGAVIVDSGEVFSISGSLLAVDAEIVDRAGVDNIQLTFRTNVQLKKQGRMIWQTTLFGRGRVPVEEGVAAAVHAAMIRIIDDLVLDDYFKMEVM